MRTVITAGQFSISSLALTNSLLCICWVVINCLDVSSFLLARKFILLSLPLVKKIVWSLYKQCFVKQSAVINTISHRESYWERGITLYLVKQWLILCHFSCKTSLLENTKKRYIIKPLLFLVAVFPTEQCPEVVKRNNLLNQCFHPKFTQLMADWFIYAILQHHRCLQGPSMLST